MIVPFSHDYVCLAELSGKQKFTLKLVLEINHVKHKHTFWGSSILIFGLVHAAFFLYENTNHHLKEPWGKRNAANVCLITVAHIQYWDYFPMPTIGPG